MLTVTELLAILDDCGDSLLVVANGHHIKTVQVEEAPARHVSLVLDPAPAQFPDVAASIPAADASQR
jgi:hypothetical protein